MKTMMMARGSRSPGIWFFFFLSMALTTTAVIIREFSGWENLRTKSPDIIIARCSRTPNANEMQEDGVLFSELEIEFALKGRTNLGSAKLLSQFWPRQGEHYLIFAQFHDVIYQAIEPYRVVPIGMYLATNSVKDKKLEELVPMLLRYRLDNLNIQLKQLQEEKSRLEQGVPK